MKEREELKKKVSRQVKRLDNARRDTSVLAQMGYFGSVGLLFVLPVVGGAYFGAWLDEKLPGFSSSWTVSFIVLGVIVGALNVYWFIRNMED
ncbi:F0F1 ATP synthase subunit [Aestuariicella hydrocarbonica]|uniref:F0F1 ATP synthase subunit n=1 Tax=Pseudomaricurvus hydrocarbonicus TaxID=1470433 RepID=A0A9E5MP38_9GAMM|nr:AtpZ/AtpI family protein [Aestuariicella hydrocarbonica]NHO67835.1 F0F1 ATP synthase subunit [Aestuariicella hydrocarbonica]